MNPQIYTQPLSDYTIDDLAKKDGILEQTPSISLDLPDSYIIKNLNLMINTSSDRYNEVNAYNLKNKRLKNAQMLEGRHLQEHKLYRHQTPYIDNEIFLGVDAIIAYVTAQTPSSEVYPASDKKESIILAKNLEKYHHYYADKINLPRKLEGVVHNMIGRYIGVLKLYYDPRKKEIITEVVDPEHLIIDYNAKLGENPRFICHVQKATVEELVSKFPDKKDKILEHFGVKRRGVRNMSAEVAYREVWFTYFDEDSNPQEAVAWYVEDLVLDKARNINWLYDDEGENFLDEPMKPFIPFNINNDGSNWIDKTNALEQSIPLQDVLNKLGRQVVDNLSTANGFKVIDGHAMTKDDAQNFTGDPNQLLLVKTKPGQSVRDVVEQLPPQVVSQQLIAELTADAQRIHGILGTPSQFTGTDDDKVDTASQALMIKNQASGRQDKIVRAIDYGLSTYFRFLTQMMVVWYDETHYATINGGDGHFDFIEMHRNKIEKGVLVHVQSGTTLPFDKARQESVALNLAKLGLISPYDVYSLLHMEHPQKLYDNFMKWKQDPQQLAMDIASDDADTDAIIDWVELINGRQPELQDNPTRKYIEELRQKMIGQDFLKASPKIQGHIIKFINESLDRMQLHDELEALSGNPPQQVPIPRQIQQTGLSLNGMQNGSPIQSIMSSAPQGTPQGMPTGMPQQQTPSQPMTAQLPQGGALQALSPAPQTNLQNPMQMPQL